MKYFTILLFILFSTIIFAQKPCDFTTNVSDSVGSYKSTKEYLVYEKNFGQKSSYIFNSLTITDGIPALNMQFIEKSTDFIKAKCFDKNSRVYIQLQNGKIITLMHIENESCGNLIRDDKGINNRLLTGYFLFRKDDYKELDKSPVLFIRVKFATQTEDYIFKKELVSELDSFTYFPENYFMDYFHCIDID